MLLRSITRSFVRAPALIGVACLLAAAAGADPPGPAAAVRSQVEAVLTAMEAAVVAGDAEAYLANVASADAWFAQEQRNWAADLLKHRPLEFDLSIAPATQDWPESFDAERAAVVLAVRYRMGFGHAAAEGGAAASWPAVFVREDPDGNGPGGPRWLYAGERWSEQAGRGFVVRYFPGAEATVADVLQAFPVARAHVNEGFEIDHDAPQVIKLFDDMEHLKATVYLSMPDRVLGGWNEPGESIKFLTRYGRDVATWTRAFAHEYGHVATWEMGPRIKAAPWWLHEGVAELAAEAFDAGGDSGNDARIRRLAREGMLSPWDAIADYQTAAPELKMLAYHQGHHFVGFVSERWGRRGRNAWLRRIGAGSTVDEATRAEFGLTFADLDAAWRASLAEEPSK